MYPYIGETVDHPNTKAKVQRKCGLIKSGLVFDAYTDRDA